MTRIQTWKRPSLAQSCSTAADDVAFPMRLLLGRDVARHYLYWQHIYHTLSCDSIHLHGHVSSCWHDSLFISVLNPTENQQDGWGDNTQRQNAASLLPFSPFILGKYLACTPHGFRGLFDYGNGIICEKAFSTIIIISVRDYWSKPYFNARK